MPDPSLDRRSTAAEESSAGARREAPAQSPWPGLLSALTFGLATPATKVVFEGVPDLWKGGWLYLASGLGLSAVVALRRGSRGAPLARADLPWLAGAIVSGAVIAPYAFTRGVGENPAFLASLLLNVEVVFTAAIAALFFGERVSGRRRVGVGLVALGGAACAAVTAERSGDATLAGCLWTILACLGWALDNNLTSRIAAKDAVAIARWKGLVGGGATLSLAAALGAWPSGVSARVWLGGAAVGVVGFGLSLVLFIRSLRALGAARTGALFGTAPFLGAVASAAFLGESVSPWIVGAGAVMAAGVVLATRSEPETPPGIGPVPR